ncbi:hypothetical protein JN531_016585 (plasmid) [Flagellatimonas centrodinii]|uniref:hypothetical protein n=1 Tax=Flagellatimonas centrodinii TaxID=2806210 RepID=UPI001FFC39D4|nr:hypothetical protein [Flagellatimonas centrodinii]ULQ48394.1 hypothetical protein JN531_016585 [Flagellatimonas centrodinii]
MDANAAAQRFVEYVWPDMEPSAYPENLGEAHDMLDTLLSVSGGVQALVSDIQVAPGSAEERQMLEAASRLLMIKVEVAGSEAESLEEGWH